jgi:Holliday junction resolvasome RuvABC DNA-binding subunit
MSEQAIIELLGKWAELKQQRSPIPPPSDYLQQQITAKLQVLNQLLSLGYQQIEGEQTDVRTTIKDLEDVLQAMRDCAR